MNNRNIFLIFIVVIFILAFLNLKSIVKQIEGFVSTNETTQANKKKPNSTEIDNTKTLYDYVDSDRATYINQGKAKYNSFSDTMDVAKGNFIHNDDPVAISQATAKIQSAFMTSDLDPDDLEDTIMGIKPLKTTAQLAPPNMVLAEAKKCESLRGRGMCGKIGSGEYKNCGLCIKGGSPYSYDNAAKHIGGLLILSDHKEEQKLTSPSANVQYQPTIGDCPSGYFFVDSDTCKKEVNRLNCKEVGESGGFNGGKTIEGKDFINQCAYSPGASENHFIYEPKTRKFDVNLRALAPTGTGLCKIFVYNSTTRIKVGYAESSTPGIEFIVPIKNVSEGVTLDIEIAMEVPFRRMGNSELFLFTSGYNQTKETAQARCLRIGATHATKTQMLDAIENGAQICSTGIGSDFGGFPGQASLSGCGTKGFNDWTYKDKNSETPKGGAWCFGVKPPVSINTNHIPGNPLPWFQSHGAASNPSQAELGNIWSRFGDDYKAPYDRGILLQWEMVDYPGRKSVRTISFQPTIVLVNDLGPNNISTDGFQTFKILRQLGTYANSTEITSPRPSSRSAMLKNQFWIWSNKKESQFVKFTAKVPGIFLDTYYIEDTNLARNGAFVGDPNTNKLLKVSPCLREGQIAGKYSLDCLKNLFISAGGDLYLGKLTKENGGLTQLNAKGDMDQIADYLSDLYTIATTGKDQNGVKVGKNNKEHTKMINEAAQLMFGFDISSPCEDINEDERGNIIIRQKIGKIDADCLDWLWMNTGSDSQRGDGDSTRQIPNTYTSIGERFSGLRRNEGSTSAREKFPFQTCQRSGSKAPINYEGRPNTAAILEANSKGSIANIQKWYDSIFQTANKETNEPRKSLDQSNAIKYCYGISKSKEIGKKIGITIINKQDEV